MFVSSPHDFKRFFSVFELGSVIRKIVDPISITWRTVGIFPETDCSFINNLERYDLINRLPLGAFVAMSVFLPSPDFLMPMFLQYSTKKLQEAILV